MAREIPVGAARAGPLRSSGSRGGRGGHGGDPAPRGGAIPMHVGEGIGSTADAECFREMATVPVIVLPIEK